MSLGRQIKRGLLLRTSFEEEGDKQLRPDKSPDEEHPLVTESLFVCDSEGEKSATYKIASATLTLDLSTSTNESTTSNPSETDIALNLLKGMLMGRKTKDENLLQKSPHKLKRKEKDKKDNIKEKVHKLFDTEEKSDFVKGVSSTSFPSLKDLTNSSIMKFPLRTIVHQVVENSSLTLYFGDCRKVWFFFFHVIPRSYFGVTVHVFPREMRSTANPRSCNWKFYNRRGQTTVNKIGSSRLTLR
eukprot:TRINITY_DN7628_c0_g1_i2.p1 TRINITY_DN7628_c0_g1~~TRINITY_DN7628_c0_g1_i2.p1  ORF type:complete len:243 (-),score=32.94 TRINITY_DN7628_c0_g1_i2:29-757(-)